MHSELREEKLRKLQLLKDAGIDPYPSRVRRTHTLAEARAQFSDLVRSGKRIAVVGRVMSIRDQGKMVFVDLVDESGRMQVVLRKDATARFALIKSVLDRGDFAAARGTLFLTKRGEKSISARTFSLVAKSILPLPPEWYGIEQTEIRLRKQYLDFLFRPEERELVYKKAVFWESIRAFLKREGFLEVATPVFETTPGGAEAEPFRTHYNALDTDFFLRISLELPLKKLLVGGFEKVFEIGRIFRNEGIDREHLQDYTQLEFYWAYRDYHDLMRFVEKMYREVIRKVCGSLVTHWQGKKIDWGKKWKKLEYSELFYKANKIMPKDATLAQLRSRARELGIKVENYYRKGRLLDLIFKKTVRPKLIQPSFLLNPPVEIEPLAKRLPDRPWLVQRMQVMACGTELGKGFSELNDPLDQRARFEEQMRLRSAGDKEAQRIDEEYLEAMEYGMPPSAGFGLSERLFAVLMDRPLRETILFPPVRPKNRGAE
ncbi:lysine--tRNA ligase [Candidatus Parcubacteria bacterium]|nr:MAG: lysine--tRNA ligase [Candidatus Parcubacteria bacterium]